jgi:hypothetical protein
VSKPKRTQTNPRSLANLRPFGKNNNANPEGARAHDPVMRAFKNLAKEELAEVGNLILQNNFDALTDLANDPQASVLQRMLASVSMRVIKQGDMNTLDLLLNRLIGKVKDEVEISKAEGPRVIVTLPSNGYEVANIKASDEVIEVSDQKKS